MSGEGREAAVEQLSASPEVGFPGEWYDLNSADHFWFRWRIDEALRQWRSSGLPLDRALRVLDVGGGKGILRDQVEASTAWTVDLVELNRPALAAAAPGRGRHLFYDVREVRPDLAGSYDVAILFDVIEHLEDPQPVLEAVRRHLKPGGILLVNVPSLQALYSSFDAACGHYRRYERATLAAEFDPARWLLLDQRFWGLSLVPLLLIRKMLLRDPSGETIRKGFGPPGRLAHWMLRCLQRLDMALFTAPPTGSSLLLVARRTGE